MLFVQLGLPHGLVATLEERPQCVWSMPDGFEDVRRGPRVGASAPSSRPGYRADRAPPATRRRRFTTRASMVDRVAARTEHPDERVYLPFAFRSETGYPPHPARLREPSRHARRALGNGGQRPALEQPHTPRTRAARLGRVGTRSGRAPTRRPCCAAASSTPPPSARSRCGTALMLVQVAVQPEPHRSKICSTRGQGRMCITGMDLRDGSTRLVLHLGLKLARLVGASPPAGRVVCWRAHR
jgi:hypothetical protein